jgi:hypothetical protein
LRARDKVGAVAKLDCQRHQFWIVRDRGEAGRGAAVRLRESDISVR